MEALIRYNFNGDGPVSANGHLFTTATKTHPQLPKNLSTTVSDWRKWNGHEIWSVRRVDDKSRQVFPIIFGKELTREKVAFREETRLEGNENGQTLRFPYPFKDILIFIVFNL